MPAVVVKKTLRPTIMAMVVAFLCLAFSGQAQAAVPATSYTYNGFTYSWTKADQSDLTVTATPGTPDKLPDGVTTANVQKAKADYTTQMRLYGVSAAAAKGADHCTYSPDKYLWFGADYRSACDAHDACYSPSSRTDRLVCDKTLLAGIAAACINAYGSKDPRRYSCSAQAPVYYEAVRKFAKSHYHGKGKND